jgi:hypothetical protein
MYANNVTTSDGFQLPKADISCEPLLAAFFDANNSNPQLTALTNQIYNAHEAKYNSTDEYVAFSEGNSFEDGFVYEWVVKQDGRTWVTTSADGATTLPSTFNPIIYNKVSISFLAIYNTPFAYLMSVYLEGTLPAPVNGYCDGADYNIYVQDRNQVGIVGSNTNGLILSAANWALQHSPTVP